MGWGVLLVSYCPLVDWSILVCALSTRRLALSLRPLQAGRTIRVRKKGTVAVMDVSGYMYSGSPVALLFTAMTFIP